MLRFACYGLLVAGAAIGGRLYAQAETAAMPPCAAPGAWVQVRAAEHSLYLCEDGEVQATYAVTLGSQPGAKRVEGDQRTPRGRYPLQPPRPSSKFLWFILIGYPTAEQRAQGYTGSAVGIHGPPRQLTKLGVRVPAWVLRMDWTDGCVAVGSDDEIDAISSWLKRTNAREIVIE